MGLNSQISPEPLTNNVQDVALVFEGGGMRASYTSAVVRTLLEAGIHFDWVAGISAGASNTVNYVSRDATRAQLSFTDFAADRSFGNIGTFLAGKGLFNAEYIYEQTAGPDQALPFDFATFTANPARVCVSAFEADTGQTVYWTKDDLATLPDLMRRVRASSTMPVLMPPVTIGKHVYVDGALGPSGGIPLERAEAEGFTRFFVVLSQPRAYVKKPQRVPLPFQIEFRRQPAVIEALADRARKYAATRARLFDLESSGQAVLFVPETMPVSNATRNVAQLRASFAAGLAQARRELPAWKDWLGIA